MKDEIAVATRWITDSLVDREYLPTEALAVFENQVQLLLEERFKGHWYEREPYRGQAFRAVIVDEHSTDRLIVKAAEKSGISDLEGRLRRRWMLWVDPGEVEVKDELTNQRTLLYKRDLASKQKSTAPLSSLYPVPPYWPSPSSHRSGRTSPSRNLTYNVNSKQFVPNSNNVLFNSGFSFENYSPQQKTILRRPSSTRDTHPEADSLEYSVYAVHSSRPELSVSSQA